MGGGGARSEHIGFSEWLRGLNHEKDVATTLAHRINALIRILWRQYDDDRARIYYTAFISNRSQRYTPSPAMNSGETRIPRAPSFRRDSARRRIRRHEVTRANGRILWHASGERTVTFRNRDNFDRYTDNAYLPRKRRKSRPVFCCA